MRELKLKQRHPKQLNASPSPNFRKPQNNLFGPKLLNPSSKPSKTIALMCEHELVLILA
jgi:hypothetical protein